MESHEEMLILLIRIIYLASQKVVTHGSKIGSIDMASKRGQLVQTVQNTDSTREQISSVRWKSLGRSLPTIQSHELTAVCKHHTTLTTTPSHQTSCQP